MSMSLLDPGQVLKAAFDDATGALKLQAIGGTLVPDHYDELNLTYSGSNVATVVYKLAGVTVATLTLGYTGSNLTSVVRT